MPTAAARSRAWLMPSSGSAATCCMSFIINLPRVGHTLASVAPIRSAAADRYVYIPILRMEPIRVKRLRFRGRGPAYDRNRWLRSEEHTSELQSLMRISYAVFCLKKKKKIITTHKHHVTHEQAI